LYTIEYVDVYFYAYDIALYKHKQTVYVVMRALQKQ
jgi:hypothetical protein